MRSRPERKWKNRLLQATEPSMTWSNSMIEGLGVSFVLAPIEKAFIVHSMSRQPAAWIFHQQNSLTHKEASSFLEVVGEAANRSLVLFLPTQPTHLCLDKLFHESRSCAKNRKLLNVVKLEESLTHLNGRCFCAPFSTSVIMHSD